MTEHGTSTPETDDFDADVDELLGKVKKGPLCTVWLMLEAHPDRERAARISEWIDDKSIPATKLAQFCAKHGGPRPAKDQAIRRHRKRGDAGGCECPT